MGITMHLVILFFAALYLQRTAAAVHARFQHGQNRSEN
jgi:hypothetical protein